MITGFDYMTSILTFQANIHGVVGIEASWKWIEERMRDKDLETKTCEQSFPNVVKKWEQGNRVVNLVN